MNLFHTFYQNPFEILGFLLVLNRARTLNPVAGDLLTSLFKDAIHAREQDRLALQGSPSHSVQKTGGWVDEAAECFILVWRREVIKKESD